MQFESNCDRMASIMGFSARKGCAVMKRILAMLACLVLLLTAAPKVSAASEEKVQQIIKQAQQIYRSSLRGSGKKSFHGYCGALTGWELRKLNINTWRVSNNGNRWYDYYKNMDITTGGFHITAYDAKDYNLKQTLNAITNYGTRDAYNILIGFQWTNTDAGRKYGHAMVINAILDGVVYFVESYDMRINGKNHKEGTVIRCSIDEFHQYYAKWTRYEGAIHFGTKQYSDTCQFVGTNVLLQTRFESTLRSQPCLVGKNDCVQLRALASGETLHATGILIDRNGDKFYEVVSGEQVGYVAANAVGVVRINAEDLNLSSWNTAEVITPDQSIALEGLVSSQEALVSRIGAVVIDAEGNVVIEEWLETEAIQIGLNGLNEKLSAHTLQQGAYSLEIYAGVTCPVVTGEELTAGYAQTRLQQTNLWVDENLHMDTDAYPPVVIIEDVPTEGWAYKQGDWYYYQNATPVTGWQSICGVTYYMDETGKAVSGLYTVDGVERRFSDMGAVISGWQEESGQLVYRLDDGSLAVGMQNINSQLHYFDDAGRPVTSGEVQIDAFIYILGEMGLAELKKS